MMRSRHLSPINVYVATVSVAGLGLLGYFVVNGGLDRLLETSAEFWVFAAFLLFGELVPIRVPHRNEQEEITTSGTFAVAMVLVTGPGPALIAHTVATLIAEIVHRKQWYKALFNAAQYALALGAARGVIALLSNVPHADSPPAFDAGDLPAILAGALAFFLTNHVLTRIAIAKSQGLPIRPALLSDFRFQASTNLVLLAFAPIVVVTAERSLAFVPLLALPMVGAYWSTSTWLQKQYKEHQALHDALTSLPNRRLFHDRISQALLGGRRDRTPVGVMIIDLDRFKEINDTLGHHTGDLLLQMIGPRLQHLLRDSDTIARLGGDEFAVLLPGVSDAAGAIVVADKILHALEEPFEIDGLSLDIDASIGIALHPDHGDDVNTLMQRADIAMYMAKEAHTGFELYTAERDHHSPRRLALLGELRRGIELGQFVLHYQPKAEMRTGRVLGVEALVRWQHPSYGLMMPDEFVPLAEHTGLIKPLTLNVLDQALRQCHAWQQQGLDLLVAVNLSVRNLQDDAFPEEVARLLLRHQVDAEALELEITESAIVVDPIRAMGVLSRLSTMGIGLSLDDFGTGYSSLAYLKRLPVREIKIDKSFVINMAVDENDAVIVRSTIELARNLGLQVVAEGVETEDTWGELASLGCDLAQGYYLSRPVPAPELFRLLEGTDSGRITEDRSVGSETA